LPTLDTAMGFSFYLPSGHLPSGRCDNLPDVARANVPAHFAGVLTELSHIAYPLFKPSPFANFGDEHPFTCEGCEEAALWSRGSYWPVT
jgi:hypothetical protein